MEWVEKKSSELYVSSSGLSKSSDQFGYGYPFCHTRMCLIIIMHQKNCQLL